MSTVVNNFSQLETMVSITSFKNPCDIVPLCSNSETLFFVLGDWFLFQTLQDEDIPCLDL